MSLPPPDCAPLDIADMVAQLALLPPARIQGWHGLPLLYLGTPEGAWRHRFTPPAASLGLLDTGRLETELRVAGRSHDLAYRAGSLTCSAAGRRCTPISAAAGVRAGSS